MMQVTVRPQNTLVTVKDTDKAGASVVPKVLRVEVAQAGVPGPDGSLVVKTCAVAISGHQAVVVNSSGQLDRADNGTPEHLNRYLGITMNAASAGAQSRVRTIGEIVEPSWNWLPDLPVYLGASGSLTQTPPASGFSLIVGFPTTPTSLLVQRRDPIVLA